MAVKRAITTIGVLGALAWSGPGATLDIGPIPWPVFQSDSARTGRLPVLGPQTATIQWQTRVEGTPGSPVVGAGDRIYVATGMLDVDAGGRLYAIDPDGTVLWHVDLAGAPGSTAPAVGPSGAVYVHVNGGSGST